DDTPDKPNDNSKDDKPDKPKDVDTPIVDLPGDAPKVDTPIIDLPGDAPKDDTPDKPNDNSKDDKPDKPKNTDTTPGDAPKDDTPDKPNDNSKDDKPDKPKDADTPIVDLPGDAPKVDTPIIDLPGDAPKDEPKGAPKDDKPKDPKDDKPKGAPKDDKPKDPTKDENPDKPEDNQPIDNPLPDLPGSAPKDNNPKDKPKDVKSDKPKDNKTDKPKNDTPKDLPTIDLPKATPVANPNQGNSTDTPKQGDSDAPKQGTDIPKQATDIPSSIQPISTDQGNEIPTTTNDSNLPKATEPPSETNIASIATPKVDTNIVPTATPNVGKPKIPDEGGEKEGSEVAGFPKATPTNDVFNPPTSIVIPPVPTLTSTTDSSSSPNIPQEIAVVDNPDKEEELLKSSDKETEITLKLNKINWESVVKDSTFATQIARFLPRDLAKSIGIPESEIRTIKLERSPDNNVYIKLAIPKKSENDVAKTIENPGSKFYTEGTELNQFVDKSSFNFSEGSTESVPSSISKPPSNRGSVIGIIVGCTTILYAGLTALYIRSQRKKRQLQLQEQQEAYFSSSKIYTPVV
ncbi:13873_t:CDS:2, partial [Rhizophagus irregularis]